MPPTGYWKITDGTLYLSPVGGAGYTEETRILSRFNESSQVPWLHYSPSAINNVVVEAGPNGEKLAPQSMDYWFT